VVGTSIPIKILDDFLFIAFFRSFSSGLLSVSVAFDNINQKREQLLQTGEINAFPCFWDFQGSPPIGYLGLVNTPQAEYVRAFMNWLHGLI
jgi:hypothetical protein